ncbi:MAG: hypothetical protein GC181_02555 [Bacteroidetes bacterium]|nr:hypothetical protein [Bacteroidota bacterium]
MRIFYCLCCFILMGDLALAQFPELAQQQAQYKDEIKTVEGLIQNQGQKAQVPFILSLARNYYRLDRYQEAEQYFLQVIDQPMCSDLDFKELAICLAMNGKESLAREFYQLYINKVPDNRSFLILWEQMRSNTGISGTPVKNQLTRYTSVYGNLTGRNSALLSIEGHPSRVNLSCGRLADISEVTIPVDEPERLASICEGPGKSGYIFSYKEPEGYYSLYWIPQKKNKWKKAVRLELGEHLANYIHPYYLEEEKKLIFSSDRSGGFGGFDLYSVEFDGKDWINVKNMGAVFNTEKNEILPQLYQNQLSFSSNGHPGRGGYDVFISAPDRSVIRGIDAPFNSTKNDYQILDFTPSEAIMVCGKNGQPNIFNITVSQPTGEMLTGKVFDTDRMGIAQARVLFRAANVVNGRFALTQTDGSFQISLDKQIYNWEVEVYYQGRNVLSTTVDLLTLGLNPLELIIKTSETPVASTNSSSPKSSGSEVQPVYPKVTSPAKTEKPAESISNHTGNTAPNTETNPPVSGGYYVVLGSTTSYEFAQSYWAKWKNTFPKSEIIAIKEDNGTRYRIAEFAGTDYSTALNRNREIRRTVTNAWLYRSN